MSDTAAAHVGRQTEVACQSEDDESDERFDKGEAIRAAEKAVETAPPGDKVGMQLKLAAVRAAAEGKK